MNKHEAAFPQSGFQQWEPMPGMSLRDYFAAKAANGLCSNGTWLQEAFSNVGSDACASAVAKASYELADAMLAAREVAK